MFGLTEASTSRSAVCVGRSIAASSGSILAGESFMLRVSRPDLDGGARLRRTHLAGTSQSRSGRSRTSASRSNRGPAGPLETARFTPTVHEMTILRVRLFGFRFTDVLRE